MWKRPDIESGASKTDHESCVVLPPFGEVELAIRSCKPKSTAPDVKHNPECVNAQSNSLSIQVKQGRDSCCATRHAVPVRIASSHMSLSLVVKPGLSSISIQSATLVATAVELDGAADVSETESTLTGWSAYKDMGTSEQTW